MSEESFVVRAERAAVEFRARYGVEGAWTDEQLDRALADHRFPLLAALPDEPRGLMVGAASPNDPPGSWRRTNAAHLLAHAMLHGGQRCGGCEDWGDES